jgi:hypothetical protein
MAVPSLAVEFQCLGFRASSMGGAGVANERGSFAPYYNPALLARHTHGGEISFSGSVSVRELNLADSMDALAEADIQETMDTFFGDFDTSGVTFGSFLSPELNESVDIIQTELTALAEQNALQIMPSGSAGFQFGNFGFGIYGVSEATVTGVIDENRLDFIVAGDRSGTTYYVKYTPGPGGATFEESDLTEYKASSIEYAIEQEYTYLDISGIAYAEIPLSYGLEVSSNLDIGLSLKVMQGVVYDEQISFDTESGDISDEFEDASESVTTFGVDLGLVYKSTTISGLAIGLVGKNLNTPEFDNDAGTIYEVEPQYRAGIAYDFLFDMFTLAIDADLSANETLIEDYQSQYVGGGIDFHPGSLISLRVGAMKNTKEEYEGLIYTGGVSFGLKWLQVDVTGQMSAEQGEFDGEEIPRYARVQASIVSKWF